MSSKKTEHRIIKSILEKTVSTTAWTFEAVAFMGIATIETFLNPSYYADPSGFYLGDSNPPSKKKPTFKEMTIRQSVRRLEKQGFVKREKGRYILTEYGKKLASYIFQKKKILNKPWDKKFRIVIFDIPESKRKMRDWLRIELISLQYRKLQESVFVGKVPLPEYLIKEIKRLKIGNCVNYILADKIYKNVLK